MHSVPIVGSSPAVAAIKKEASWFNLQKAFDINLTWIDHGNDSHRKIYSERVGVDHADAGQEGEGVSGAPSL